MSVIEVLAQNYLPLLQSISSNLKGGHASNTLIITDSARSNKLYVKAQNTLYLNQVANPRTSIKNVNAQNTLFLWDAGRKVVIVDVLQTFFAWQQARTVKFEKPSNILLLGQSAVGIAGRAAKNSLSIGQSAIVNLIRTVTAQNTLSLQQLAPAYLPRSTYIGTIQPTLSHTKITLYCEGVTLQLRAPDFNNKDTVEITRINRTSRAGDLVIFRDPQWPKTNTLTFAVSFINKDEVRQLINFLKKSAGKDITLTDYEGRNWIGVIVTPSHDIVQSARFNQSFTFEFLGNLS